MSKRDFDRAVDRWLDDGSDATPPEVIDAVLRAARYTPQERHFRVPWRASPMPYLRLVALSVSAALVGLAGLYAFGTGSVPTPSPSESSSPDDGSLPVGPHVMVGASGTGLQKDRVTVNIPAPGWFAGLDEASVTKDDEGDKPVSVVSVSADHYLVPENICTWQAGNDLVHPDEPPGGLRAHELVLYLTQQTHDADGSLTRDLSTPVDVTIDGQLGNSLTGTLPQDPLACDEERFCSLLDQDGAECLLVHERNQIVTLWVSDHPEVGLWVVAASYWPTTNPELLAEMHAIVDSMSIVRE